MASSQLTLLALISSILVLLSTSGTVAQSPAAPAPAPPGPVNFTGILAKAGQYNTFIHMLTVETQVASQIENQLNTSTEGLTVFAPTDNAFANLKAGTLNQLSTEKKVMLLLYHVLPKYYTLESLVTVSNPVRTQASNYGLNFTGQANTNQVNVSSGLVETMVNNALYNTMPLAVYQVDKVLLPRELFEAPAPATSTPASDSSDGSSTPSTPAKGPSSSVNNDSGASQMTMLSGLVGGFLAICMGTLL